MNFLTPLYVAGVMAVALPVVLHLLRRSPQRRQTFSSLMFLAPSPPQATRNSRISNWPLLLLRAAAVTLLALAFARPFFGRDVAVAANAAATRRVAILIDTSASMRRGDLWQQAKRHADAVLNTLSPADKVALYFFDRTVRPAFTFAQGERLDPSQRIAAVRAALEGAAPTWHATAIGDSVARVADDLAAVDSTPNASGTASIDAGPRTLVLISDLQSGGRPEALQGHAWPETVRLDVRPVAPATAANAAVQLVRPQPDAADAADDRPRVRVTNVAANDADQFTLAWADANGPIKGLPPAKAYAPAGRGQTVRLAWPPAGTPADRIVLQGDAADFDNTLFVARPQQATARVVFAGDDAADDANALAFYLRTALGDTPQRKVEIVQQAGESLAADDLRSAGLLVVARPLTDAAAADVRTFADAGGTVLWVLRQAADAGGLPAVTGVNGMNVAESADANFALLARLDTAHPLLSTFADARFGDFGRVHFWKHRTVSLPPGSGVRTLASFDNGDAFLLEKAVGRGRLLLMTSGWQPRDSQLALSSKFVPILDGLLSATTGDAIETTAFVGDVPAVPTAGEKPWTLRTPDGRTATLTTGTAEAFDRPGLYAIDTGRGSVDVAVNLRPEESRTVPIAAADFKQWGVRLDSGDSATLAPIDPRQARRAELEGRQKLWQWLIVGVLGFVAAETALAGRLARRTNRTVTVAGNARTTS